MSISVSENKEDDDLNTIVFTIAIVLWMVSFIFEVTRLLTLFPWICMKQLQHVEYIAKRKLFCKCENNTSVFWYGISESATLELTNN